MPPEATAAALLSALVHASWNAFLKAGRDRLIDLGVMGIGGSLFGISVVAWRGLPLAASWPYLVGSGIVHLAYWLALARSYSSGDMSQVYTIARGLAPALVTVGAMLAAQEAPTPSAAVGIAAVSAGIGAIGFSSRAPGRATAWAILTGVTIATYSLLDALGARASGNVIAYVGASALANFVPITVLLLPRRGIEDLSSAMRGRWWAVMGAGAISNAGFGLALWAQTIAPIAYVTALRETSVVFGAGIAATALRERVSARRWLGALVVAAGAALIAFGR